jgi:enoyl-CoA hydratase/carnithine racemase
MAVGELAATPGDPAMGDNFAATFSYFLAVRKPVIAAINGPCAGLGLCFALLCDLRFAERGARFNTAFAARGLVAEHGMSWLLPRLVGSGRALDLLWTARKFTAEEAERWGLIERLCENGTSLAAAREYVMELARDVSPTSLMVMKQQVYRHLMQALGPAMQDTERLMQESLGRPDFREGVRSFLEQRPPRFGRLGSG